MYEYIVGIYKGMKKDYIIVENNGIGYKINTSGSTLTEIPGVGSTVKIYTKQIVREDFIGLYGFLTIEEVEMFNLLLNVNGIGAKAALSLLSITNVNNLKQCILSGDEKTIVKAPGIGKKTAQRVILELKDKIDLQEIYQSYGNSDIGKSKVSDKIQEASEALEALGYLPKEVSKSMDNVDANTSVEDMIKCALKFLMS